MARRMIPREYYKNWKKIARSKLGVNFSIERAKAIHESLLVFIMDELIQNEHIQIPRIGTLYVSYSKPYERYLNDFKGGTYRQWCEEALIITFRPTKTFKRMIVDEKEIESKAIKKRRERKKEKERLKLEEEFRYRMTEDNLDVFIARKLRGEKEVDVSFRFKEEKVSNKNRKVYCEELNKTFSNATACVKYFREELDEKVTVRGIALNCTNECRHHHNYHFHFVDDYIENYLDDEENKEESDLEEKTND